MKKSPAEKARLRAEAVKRIHAASERRLRDHMLDEETARTGKRPTQVVKAGPATGIIPEPWQFRVKLRGQDNAKHVR